MGRKNREPDLKAFVCSEYQSIILWLVNHLAQITADYRELLGERNRYREEAERLSFEIEILKKTSSRSLSPISEENSEDFEKYFS